MKKYYLFLLMALVTQKSLGQKIHFTDYANTWYCTGVDSPGQNFWAYYVASNAVLDVGTIRYRSITGFGNETPFYSNGGWVGEDTTSGIVYRLNDLLSEGVLYKFGLHLGDTVHLTFANPPHIDSVIGIDSMLINGQYYKIFRLVEIDTDYIHEPGYSPYLTYVEGIGCVFDPLQQHYEARRLGDTVSLKCFYSGLTSWYTPPPFAFSYNHPTLSDTVHIVNGNCAHLSVRNELIPGVTIKVVPNPVDVSSAIFFGKRITGDLAIYNCMGNVVYLGGIENKDEIPFGEKISVPGIYYYIFQEKSGNQYSGTFIKDR
jgi:hypothetical protein